VYGQGANASATVGWVTNAFSPGNIATIDFNSYADGNILVLTGNSTSPKTWAFDPTGNLTLPGNTFAVNYANGIQVSIGGGGNTGNFVFDSYSLDSTTFDEITVGEGSSGNILINSPGLAMVLAGGDSGGMVASEGNVWVFNGDPTFANGIPQYGVGQTWQFDNNGNLYVPQGGWIGSANEKGGTKLTGGRGNIASLTSYYANVDALNYSSCVTLNADGTANITTYGDGTGQLGQWGFANANFTLATVNNESAQFVGARKVIGGLNLTSPYAVTLSAGGTPTVAYTSLAGSNSVKVTFAIQSGGGTFQWEQFDVVAVPSQDVAGTVNFVVSNRIKAAAGVADTEVTATMSGSQIVISLNMAAGQTSGEASYDAVEFGLMVD